MCLHLERVARGNVGDEDSVRIHDPDRSGQCGNVDLARPVESYQSGGIGLSGEDAQGRGLDGIPGRAGYLSLPALQHQAVAAHFAARIGA